MIEPIPIKHPGVTPRLILQADGLRFAYPQRVLFEGLTVRIPTGVSLLRGGDAVGKTTLLRLLSGELTAQAGSLQVNDARLADQPDAYRRQIFRADPRSEAFDQSTPLECFQSTRQRYPEFRQSLLDELTEGLSLTSHLHKQLFMLSTGSRRKVWLAAAFASGAAVTLLDEPFAALDKASIGFVMDLLEEVARHSSRAWVIADYEAPVRIPLVTTIDLGG